MMHLRERLATVALAAVTFIIIFAVSSIQDNLSAGNINQCVEFTIHDGLIYYIHIYDGGTLHSMNTDGSDDCKLTDDRITNFYISQIQIYYTNDNDSGKLYAINIDGSGRHKVSDDKMSRHWNVAGDLIYYENWDDSKLYSIGTDGSDRKKMNTGRASDTIVLKDRIYYTKGLRGTGIFSMKIDGSEKARLGDDSVSEIVVVGKWIYYTNTEDERKLYAMRVDGSDRRRLTDDYAQNIKVIGNRIYYKNREDGKFYSIGTDGSDRQLVSDDYVSSFAIWDGRIYYMMTGTNIYSMNVDGSDKQLIANLDSDAYKDVTYEIKASLHEDMPEYRFVATGMVGKREGWMPGYVMGLEVFDEGGRSILSADFSHTYYDEVTGNPIYNEMMDTMGLHVVDVNFDGYKDVIILDDFAGVHGNTWYNCWLWEPETSSFVESKSFAKICNPALEPEEKCIYSTGGSGAAYWGGTIYKYIDGEFIITNDLYTGWDGLVEKKLVNGRMEVVREVSYNGNYDLGDVEREYYKNHTLWQLDHPHWYWIGGHHADQWLGD